MKIKSGDVIIFPTDTVYGMGALVNDIKGQEIIYELKNRPSSKRLSILCASLEDIKKIAIVDIDAERVIKKFMPGGLTLILKTKPEIISDSIHETIGVRIPNHELALRLLEENGPMATTSVNKSGFPPMNDYWKIVKEFGDKVFYVFPNVEVPSKKASTIIDMTVSPYKVLREGEIKLEDILNYLNNNA